MRTESFEVNQVHERVFLIGKLDNIDFSFIIEIINILNKGGKFVPSFNISFYDIFKNLLYFFDKEFCNFNKNLYLKKFCNFSLFNSNETDELNLNNHFEVDSNNLDCLDIFFKKCKFAKDPKNFPLLSESIDFRFEFFNYISQFKFKLRNNISIKNINSIFKYIRSKPFKIIDTDKNVGLALISNNLYFEIANSHLRSNNVYESIDNFDLNNIISSINNHLINLKLNKDISKKTI